MEITVVTNYTAIKELHLALMDSNIERLHHTGIMSADLRSLKTSVCILILLVIAVLSLEVRLCYGETTGFVVARCSVGGSPPSALAFIRQG